MTRMMITKLLTTGWWRSHSWSREMRGKSKHDHLCLCSHRSCSRLAVVWLSGDFNSKWVSMTGVAWWMGVFIQIERAWCRSPEDRHWDDWTWVVLQVQQTNSKPSEQTYTLHTHVAVLYRMRQN